MSKPLDKRKNLIIFDGSNFYHKAKKVAENIHLTSFKYVKLCQLMVGSGCYTNKIVYCVGKITKESDNKKSQVLYSQQQALLYALEKQRIKVKLGFMLNTKGIY